MTRTQYTKAIEHKLAHLNARIDAKILRGESYCAESRTHKMLLQKIRYQKQSSIFGRLLFAFN